MDRCSLGNRSSAKDFRLLQAYDVALNAKQDTTALAATVTAELATVAVDIAQVKALYTTPNCGS